MLDVEWGKRKVLEECGVPVVSDVRVDSLLQTGRSSQQVGRRSCLLVQSFSLPVLVPKLFTVPPDPEDQRRGFSFLKSTLIIIHPHTCWTVLTV